MAWWVSGWHCCLTAPMVGSWIPPPISTCARCVNLHLCESQPCCTPASSLQWLEDWKYEINLGTWLSQINLTFNLILATRCGWMSIQKHWLYINLTVDYDTRQEGLLGDSCCTDSRDKGLLVGLFFLLIGKISIFSSPSSDTYSYSSRTGLTMPSFKFCTDPNSDVLVWVLRVLKLCREKKKKENKNTHWWLGIRNFRH